MTDSGDLEKEFDKEFSHVAWNPENKARLLQFIQDKCQREKQELIEKITDWVVLIVEDQMDRAHMLAKLDQLASEGNKNT